MISLDNTIERKKKANRIIRFRTLFATGAGFIPVPVLDAAGILSIQLWMIRDLAKVYEVPFKKHLAKSLVGTLIGNIGSVGVVKFIPGLGSLLGGGAVAVSGAAATYALGKIFTQHFDQGGTLLSFDPVKSQEHFQKLYEEGKASVQELEGQEASFQNAHTQAVASTTALKQANDELRETITALQNQLEQGKQDRKFVVAAVKDQKKRRSFRWLWRLLLLLLLAAGSWWLNRAGYLNFKTADAGASRQTTATAGKKKKAADAADAAPDSTVTAQDSLAAAAEASTADAPENPDAAVLGLSPGTTEALIADLLSKPNAKFPKTFPLTAVQFEEGMTEVPASAREQIANIVKVLEKYPDAQVKIIGHSDQNGGQAANRQAGRNRAKAIENALKQAGIPGRRIKTDFLEKEADTQGTRGADIEVSVR